MNPEEASKKLKKDMHKAVDYMKHEFSTVRTGKATPALIENLDVHVSSYGSNMKLKGVAVISAPEPRLLVVSPFDPSTTKDIEKAVRESKLGLNPLSEGKNIRIPIPELSGERRQELVKTIRGMAEDARIRIRAIRKEGMDSAKKMKADNIINEDAMHDFEKNVQNLTDRHVKDIDQVVATKEAEVLKV